MNYLLRPRVSPKVLEAFPKNAAEYAEMFKSHNKLNTRAKNPLYHLSIRLPDEIRPNKEEFTQLAADVLNGMGLGLNRPYVVVMHEDEDEEPGRHIHIVTSRIDYSGKMWYGRHDAKQAIALCRQLGKPERFKDVDPTYKDRDWGNDLSASAPLTHGETMLKKRTGAWLDKDHVSASMALVLHALPRKGQAPMTKEFMEECAMYGITPKVIHRASGKHGLVYNYNGKDYKASSLGRVYTLNGLTTHFRSASKDGEPPAISLPLKSKDAYRAKAWDALQSKGKRMAEDEKQELPEAAGLYEMARELRYCEFDDLRGTGESIDTQLSFKMMSKDVLSLYQVFVRLTYLDLQNRRQEQERLRAIRPKLIRIKPEELDASDEEYRERVLPRISKYSEDDDRTTYGAWRGAHRQEERYPYLSQCTVRTLQVEEAKKYKADCQQRAHATRLEIEEAKFNKKGFIGKFLHKKNNPPPAAPPPFKYPTKAEILDANDADRRDERKRMLFYNYLDLRERGIPRGVVIDSIDRRNIEAEERHKAELAAQERSAAEKAAVLPATESIGSPEAEAPPSVSTPVTPISSASHAKPGRKPHSYTPGHSPSKGRSKRHGGVER